MKLTDKQREHMKHAHAGARQVERCLRRIKFAGGKWYCPACDYRNTGYMGGLLPYCETRDSQPPVDGICGRKES